MKEKKRSGTKWLILLILVLLTAGVVGYRYHPIHLWSGKQSNQTNTAASTATASPDSVKREDLPGVDRQKPDDVDQLLESLTLDEKIDQMFFVTPEVLTGVGQVISAGETTRLALEEHPVGGMIYFAANFQNRDQTVTMIQNSQDYSRIPLFIGVDEEGGKVIRIANNPEMETTKIEDMKTVGESKDLNRAYEIGQTLGSELSELGFNVDFAPVADLLINPNNTEIGTRSFGNDPKIVSQMVENVVKGLEEKNVSSVLKHFPGHGSTQTDSHTGKSLSTRTTEELKKNEFLPFQAGIDAGADFVLISHMTLTEATKEQLPASLSKEVMTDWLKGELGFQGIVITDSFSMGAIVDEYALSDAVVMSINAGADIILMPPDLEKAHQAVLAAVKDGTLSEERIDESVRKILKLKMEKGMF